MRRAAAWMYQGPPYTASSSRATSTSLMSCSLSESRALAMIVSHAGTFGAETTSIAGVPTVYAATIACHSQRSHAHRQMIRQAAAKLGMQCAIAFEDAGKHSALHAVSSVYAAPLPQRVRERRE